MKPQVILSGMILLFVQKESVDWMEFPEFELKSKVIISKKNGGQVFGAHCTAGPNVKRSTSTHSFNYE